MTSKNAQPVPHGRGTLARRRLSTASLLRRGWLLAIGLALPVTAVLAAPPAACAPSVCPPLSLRVDDSFEVSRQRLLAESGDSAPSVSTALPPAPVAQPPQPSFAPVSAWLTAALALAAGMLLLGLLQMRVRRRAARPSATVPSRSEPDSGRLAPSRAATLADDDGDDTAAVAQEQPRPDCAETGSAGERPGGAAPAEEGERPVVPPNVTAALAEVAITGCAPPAERWIPAAPTLCADAPAADAEPGASLAAAIPDTAAEAPSAGAATDVSAARDAVGVEPADNPASAPACREQAGPAHAQRFAEASTTTGLAEAGSRADARAAGPAAADPPERVAEADAPVTGPGTGRPAAAGPAAPIEPAFDEWFRSLDARPAAAAEPLAADPTATVAGTASASASASDASPADDEARHLDTVDLLKRLSAQRARGLHPEARLSAVFRQVAAGRLGEAQRELLALEAFCSAEGLPTELLTTRQHVARRRDRLLQTRIELLRVRAAGEAAGRRLAVAEAFLRRERFEAVTEVLDELELQLAAGEVA